MVNANPNGRSTSPALTHSGHAGVTTSVSANSWERFTMTANSSASTSHVIDEIEADGHVPSGIKLYLFGWCLHDPGDRNDVDVLLVYPHGELGSAHGSLSRSVKARNRQCST